MNAYGGWIFVGVIVAIVAIGIVLGWRQLRGKRPLAGKTATKEPSAGKTMAKINGKVTEKSSRAAAKSNSGLERKYLQARQRFNRMIDKRIAREPFIGDRLRKTRDLVLSWYGQKGKVTGIRFQNKDTRAACKVCAGRHGKEYALLKVDVVAQILPPCHADSGGKQECSCSIMAILSGDEQSKLTSRKR
ncbi:MAG: hypothetical protein HY692_09375 [Cyanobacteria bacterium NC_groundwater_1444_Ag_S-0.65um_54_12]|nr:hypothetical protein [Cyanobacteria bacterium NC_groundwater_1444_Ag_S-0.65um_54_12]